MKKIKYFLLCLCSVIIIVIITQYLFYPVYSFKDKAAFKGDSIYNPYAAMVSGQWVRCNFHSHVRCWQGVTNGEGSAWDMYHAYTQLHYGVHSISNYQSIDTTGQYLPGYISSYEHGYNILKNHQLVIGADNVCWKDYLLPQTINNKQDIINSLSESDANALIVINHPMVRNGYSASDFKQLTNYSCMEVLNPACNSSVLWDAALSAGTPVFIIGDDDTHNFSDTNRVGKISTWVNVPAVNKSNVVHALKSGCSYGLTASERLMELQRKGYGDSIPRLQEFRLSKNTVYVKFNLPANNIIVSGGNGTILHKTVYSDSLSFVFNKEEPYARITALYDSGTQLLLNPIFHYQEYPLRQPLCFSNNKQTMMLRCIGLMILLFWFQFVFSYVTPVKKQKEFIPGVPIFSYVSYMKNYIKAFRAGQRNLAFRINKYFNYFNAARKSKAE